MKTAQQIAQEWIAQMNDNHIRCPNCGSSAQVVCEWHSTNFYNNFLAEYTCGCGCTFEVTFTPSAPRILNKEKD